MLTDLDDFYCFGLVVEHGGFSAAERATDFPKSKLSRRVYNLEEKIRGSFNSTEFSPFRSYRHWYEYLPPCPSDDECSTISA